MSDISGFHIDELVSTHHAASGNATGRPLQVIVAAARLLQSPFIGDKHMLTKQILDSALVLEAQLGVVLAQLHEV